MLKLRGGNLNDAQKPFQFFGRLWDYLWRCRLTRQGQFLVAGGVISAILAAGSINVPVYLIFLVHFFLGLMALLVNLFQRNKLEISAYFPRRGVAGQVITAEADIRNAGRRSAYDISVGFLILPSGLQEEENEAFAPCLRAGEATRIPLRVTPLRRGVYTLPALRAYSTFPFNFLRWSTARQDVDALIVQPAFTPLQSVELDFGFRYQPGGVALTSDVGESPEYIGNREFRPGDSMRRIDFRSWARTGSPAVREYQEEYYSRLALVLDTFVPKGRRPGKEGFQEFEAAVSLTAAIADAVSRGEHLVDIFAAGPKVHIFHAGRHIAHLENILEILACVEPCRRNPFPEVGGAIAEELIHISAVIFIFLDWDESRRALVRLAIESGCAAKVIVLRDKPPSVPYEDDAGFDVRCLSPDDVRGGGMDIL
jgi:uncharacterized protein (DUF58 family)